MKQNWFGNLTIDNTEEVAKHILNILDEKKFSFVSVYEYKRFEPETRLHQKLENGSNGSPLSVWTEDGYAGFNFCDTYGVWGCTTADNVYIVFNWDKQITISKKTGVGQQCYWQITVEDE